MFAFRPIDPETALNNCIDTDTACQWLRIDTGQSAETELVNGLIQSAMAKIETHCHQPIFQRDYYGYNDTFRNGCLHSLNVTSVMALEYQLMGSADWIALDGEHYTFWETGEVFFYNVQGIQGVVRIRISYTAGYSPTALPADILQVVRLLIGRWYDNRADEKKDVPSQAEWLLDGYVLPLC